MAYHFLKIVSFSRFKEKIFEPRIILNTFSKIIPQSQILFKYIVHFYVCLLIYEKRTVINFFTLTKDEGNCPLYMLRDYGPANEDKNDLMKQYL